MKNRKFLAGILAGCLALSLAACGNTPDGDGGKNDGGKGTAAGDGEKITVVLDWTPNTNHTGMYVALEKGYYKEAGLEVEIMQPPEDGASALVAAGKAEFGINAQDTIAPAFAMEQPLPVTAVAALIQHNTSGIISRKGEGIDHPGGLAGKTYATWDNPVEQAMIENVVNGDGGDYGKVNLIPNNITDEAAALEMNQTDAIWVFYGWGGISAKLRGVETDFFNFVDYNKTFDYYTPVLIANNDFLAERPEAAKAFLAATARGYEDAVKDPEEAAKILCTADPSLDKELVSESQKWLADQYMADTEQWGYIDPTRWNGFYQWLWENQLISVEIPENFGFSNDYLAK